MKTNSRSPKEHNKKLRVPQSIHAAHASVRVACMEARGMEIYYRMRQPGKIIEKISSSFIEPKVFFVGYNKAQSKSAPRTLSSLSIRYTRQQQSRKMFMNLCSMHAKSAVSISLRASFAVIC
jgi:hypothetical protein